MFYLVSLFLGHQDQASACVVILELVVRNRILIGKQKISLLLLISFQIGLVERIRIYLLQKSYFLSFQRDNASELRLVKEKYEQRKSLFTSGNPQQNHTFDLFKLGYSDRETKGLGGGRQNFQEVQRRNWHKKDNTIYCPLLLKRCFYVGSQYNCKFLL